MKKIISLLVCIVLMFSVCITASAEGNSTISGNSSVTVGSDIEFIVSISGCADATAIGISVSYGNNFELVSGTWLKSGSLVKFDHDTKKGALGSLSSPNVNGNIFKLVLKAKNASANAQTVSVNVIVNNSSTGTEIMNDTQSKEVKINCATHNYGSFTNKDASNHSRTCSACGAVETNAHTWNGGTVTKTANCKETGTKVLTCTACNATKTETIAKTNNHTFGSWTQTKAPACTTTGSESRTCSTCQRVETRDIAATGHSMSGWTTTKAATCEGTGEQTRTCSKCSHKETQAISALGHKFSNPTITKQPTCTETGIESGTCTVCGKTTTNTIKATGHKFGEWTIRKAPTCTEVGSEEHKCSKCNKVENREVAALGHDFDESVVVKQPTLTEKGIEEGICKNCGEKTQAEIPCTFKDVTTGIEIKTEEGVFEKGTEIKIEAIKEEHTNFEAVKTALKEVASKFVAYDVYAVLNNAVVQPNGTVTVSFKIPEGFGKNVAVYYISDDGVSEKLESVISEDGANISANLTHFSSYAVVDLDSVRSEQAAGSLVWIIVAVVAVLLIGGGVAAIIIIKKKKSKTV